MQTFMKDANVQEGFDGQPHCWTSPEQKHEGLLFSHEEVLVTGSSSPVLTPVHKGNTATFFFFRTTHTIVSNKPAEANIVSFPELGILDAGTLSGCVNTRSNNTG